MNKVGYSVQENASNEEQSAKPLDISQIYDQYAAVLLGVITEIVADREQATALLEIVFRKLMEQTDQLQKATQPLFIILLQIARRMAIDALKDSRQPKLISLQLADDGKIINFVRQKDSLRATNSNRTNSPEFQRQELLNCILFKNCTPEEAASSLGLPVERARQHLRSAFQQVRIPKA